MYRAFRIHVRNAYFPLTADRSTTELRWNFTSENANDGICRRHEAQHATARPNGSASEWHLAFGALAWKKAGGSPRNDHKDHSSAPATKTRQSLTSRPRSAGKAVPSKWQNNFKSRFRWGARPFRRSAWGETGENRREGSRGGLPSKNACKAGLRWGNRRLPEKLGSDFRTFGVSSGFSQGWGLFPEGSWWLSSEGTEPFIRRFQFSRTRRSTKLSNSPQPWRLTSLCHAVGAKQWSGAVTEARSLSYAIHRH